MKVRKNVCKQVRIYNPQPEGQVNLWRGEQEGAV